MQESKPAIYRIEGGKPLSGTIWASGNKNAALPCLAATLLTSEPVILRNVPDIEDVRVLLYILGCLGTSVTKLDANSYKLETPSLYGNIPQDFATKLRGSILLAGPILARNKSLSIVPPGGDIIGKRRLDSHFIALQTLGARCSIKDERLEMHATKLVGTEIFLDEASVTATENAIMAAVLAEGTTIIRNAASEPHVEDLCNMLVAMGAKISGIASNLLHIEGVKELGGADFTIGPDFMEIGSYIGLIAATGGSIEIKGVRPADLRPLKTAFGKLGIVWEERDNAVFYEKPKRLKVKEDLGGMIPKISDGPWPAFPTDLTSILVVVATQTQGVVLIHEKMYESRLYFTDDLVAMGARIVLCDPHRAMISGPADLRGRELSSPDVRAGMAQIIAALCANGSSTIRGIYQIERGYEDVYQKLKSLGAKIERIELAKD